MRKFVLIAGAAIALGVVTAPLANADKPPCANFGTCKYMPNPYYDGPMMPTWNVPGTYGGWTTLPVMCDPTTYSCHTYAPMS